MGLVRFRSLRSTLAVWLSVLFAVQVLVAAPQHFFHEAAGHVASGDHRGPHDAPALPDDCRCDLCVALGGFDSASAIAPPAPVLTETAFAVVAAYASFEYSRPHCFAQARGPPSFAA